MYSYLPSLKLTANVPENGPGPKRKWIIFQPSIFRGENVSSREGNYGGISKKNYKKYKLFHPQKHMATWMTPINSWWLECSLGMV